jgi:ABC-type amino acid transport system permease subunit
LWTVQIHQLPKGKWTLDTLTLSGFGPEGWRPAMLRAATNTVAKVALVLAVIGARQIKPLNWLANGKVYVFHGTPLRVQLSISYNGLAHFHEITGSFDVTPPAIPARPLLVACTAAPQAAVQCGQTTPFS